MSQPPTIFYPHSAPEEDINTLKNAESLVHKELASIGYWCPTEWKLSRNTSTDRYYTLVARTDDIDKVKEVNLGEYSILALKDEPEETIRNGFESSKKNTKTKSDMKAIGLSDSDNEGFNKYLKYVKEFCRNNPCSVGGAEVLLGAGLIMLGAKLGAIHMGTHIVGVAGSPFNVGSLIGTGVGSIAAGTTVGSLLGNIGVAAGGTAVSIPAGLLAIAGAGVGAITGFSVGDVAHRLLSPAFNPLKYIGAGSLLMVGTALIVDGCRRILGSAALKKAWSNLKNGVLYLADVTANVVCSSLSEFRAFRTCATELVEQGASGVIALVLMGAATPFIFGAGMVAGIFKPAPVLTSEDIQRLRSYDRLCPTY